MTIYDGLASIGDYAFSYCNSLKNVVIPDSVTTIGENPFKKCKDLASIMISPDHPTLATINGVLFDKTDKRLIWYPMSSDA